MPEVIVMNWLIIPCQGCNQAVIRVRAGEQHEGMRCKWCEATDLHGSPYAIYNAKLYPPKAS